MIFGLFRKNPQGEARRLAKDYVLWGAERIRGELQKLAIRVSKRTIQKYIRRVRPPGKRGQTWRTFLRSHRSDIWACDFLQLHDVLFRPIFALLFVVHGAREVAHFSNSARPHQGLHQRIPSAAKPQSVAPAGDKVVAFPILGGLHHDYRLAA